MALLASLDPLFLALSRNTVWKHFFIWALFPKWLLPVRSRERRERCHNLRASEIIRLSIECASPPNLPLPIFHTCYTLDILDWSFNFVVPPFFRLFTFSANSCSSVPLLPSLAPPSSLLLFHLQPPTLCLFLKYNLPFEPGPVAQGSNWPPSWFVSKILWAQSPLIHANVV